jgi:acetyltransferase-like isoleucine patch superfamily enzyme
LLNRSLLEKVRRNRRHFLAYALGLLVRHKFTSAGHLLVIPGFPLPAIRNRGEIHVSNIALFPGVRIECQTGGSVRIGKGTYLNRNTAIVAAQQVTIGANCKIAWDVLIMDTDQHALRDGEQIGTRPVLIEDDVWIGARAIILKGVTIGQGAVIGAGAIVTKDVSAQTLVVGPRATAVRALG